MKTSILAFSLLAGILLIPRNAQANTDGNTLLQECKHVLKDEEQFKAMNKAEALEAGLCLGLMQGITTLNYIYQVRDKKRALFCLPDGSISNGQAARIVVKHLEEHPEELHVTGSLLAIDALRAAFPCEG